MSHGEEAIAVGCCGFPRSRAEYFRQFRLVEVQQTFYRLPRLETAQRWRGEAPPGFAFTMKASQLITHPASSPTYRRSGLDVTDADQDRYGFFRPTDEVRMAWERSCAIARALESPVVLFQCPASFREGRENVRNLRRFFESVQAGVRGTGLLLAWEPRGPWAADTVRGICEEMGLLHATDPLVQSPLWGEPWYLRLHGGAGYAHQYSREELTRLTGMIEGRRAYVLFNNMRMFEDALAFMDLLRGKV